jgi:hypothetical protein
MTWQKWGTVVIDCGREMYVPAALSTGKRLYFDVWYPYGPLIPYWHALLFRAFGVHLYLLEAAGIATIAVTTAVLYSLGRMFLPWQLAFAGAFALLLQAFQTSTSPLAEFNYVLPYSYPAAYGVMLFTLLAWVLIRDALHPRPWRIWLAGGIAGLEAITKIEFGVAAFLLVGGAIVLRAVRTRSVRALGEGLLACLPGMVLVCGVYGWYVRTGGLRFLFEENIAILPDAYFTRRFGSLWAHVTGAAANPRTVALWTVCGIAGPLLWASCLRFASVSRRRALLIAAAGLGIAAIPIALWTAGVRLGLPVIQKILENLAEVLFFNRGMALAAGLLLARTIWKRRFHFERQDVALILLLAAGIALDWRTMFRTQMAGYSIFYDPLIFVCYLIVIKQAANIAHAAGNAKLWSCAAGVLCCGLIALVAPSYSYARAQTFRIVSSRGSIYEDPWTGKAFTSAVDFLRRPDGSSVSFVAWPEEAALYFFSGTTAPSRWIGLTPGMLPPRQIPKLLAELDRKAVNYVVLSDRATPEYHLPVFGVDYNQTLYEWLQMNFHVTRTFGDFDRQDPRHWAVQIWERNDEGAGVEASSCCAKVGESSREAPPSRRVE